MNCYSIAHKRMEDKLIFLLRISSGTKQNGEELGDIKLPPWAKGDAIEFIRLHREVKIIFKFFFIQIFIFFYSIMFLKWNNYVEWIFNSKIILKDTFHILLKSSEIIRMWVKFEVFRRNHLNRLTESIKTKTIYLSLF